MRGKFLLHFLIISILLLISAILNAYTVTHLTREISKKKRELRTLQWKHDETRYERFATWPYYLHRIIQSVEQ